MKRLSCLPLALVTCSSLALAQEVLPSRDEARKLFNDQPRTVERVREAAEKLALVANRDPNDYDDQWQAARAWEWLADYELKKNRRKRSAKNAIDCARRACKADDKRVEGHYYLGVSIGALADIERGFGALGLIVEMEKELNRALEIDERFDEGGPNRELGLLKLDAPGSYNEKIRNGSKLIDRAVELSPRFPENQIALAKLLHKQGDEKGATAALNKVLAARPWPSKPEEDPEWKKTARGLLEQWSPKPRPSSPPQK